MKYFQIFFLLAFCQQSSAELSEHAAVNLENEWSIEYREKLFDSNVGFDYLGNQIEFFDQKMIWGAQAIYCAEIANILNKAPEAIKLYKEGVNDLTDYAKRVSSKSGNLAGYNMILNFSEPDYILNPDIVKGMVIQNIIHSIDLQFYTIDPTRQTDLKVFYSDECSTFLNRE